MLLIENPPRNFIWRWGSRVWAFTDIEAIVRVMSQ
jgi:hypothetical protein